MLITIMYNFVNYNQTIQRSKNNGAKNKGMDLLLGR